MKKCIIGLPYLVPMSFALSPEQLLDLEESARENLRLKESEPMSSLEILNQAYVEGLFSLNSDEWEHNILEWPIRHNDKKREEEDTEFLFTQEEFIDWIEQHIRKTLNSEDENSEIRKSDSLKKPSPLCIAGVEDE